MNSLLAPEAILQAAHLCYAAEYAGACEEQGISIPPGTRLDHWVPRCPNSTPHLEIAWRLIGRIEGQWGAELPLLFYHAGWRSTEAQIRPLFHLFMGAIGHGLTIWDDYEVPLTHAAQILGVSLDPAGLHQDWAGEAWRELAEAQLNSRKRPH